MSIYILIGFIAFYCWLGCSWRKDKQFMKELNGFRNHLPAFALSAERAAQSLHLFGAACAFYAGMSRARRNH